MSVLCVKKTSLVFHDHHGRRERWHFVGGQSEGNGSRHHRRLAGKVDGGHCAVLQPPTAFGVRSRHQSFNRKVDAADSVGLGQIVFACQKGFFVSRKVLNDAIYFSSIANEP